MGNKQPKPAKTSTSGISKQNAPEKNGRKTTLTAAGLQLKPVSKKQKKLDYARWRKFLKAFFKKIETEGPGNMSLEWLTSAQDVFLAEIERDTSIYPEQKELELLQHEGNSRAEKGVHELESTDGFEMNYEEYKLNEILGTGHTVIETVLLKDSASGGSSSGNKNAKSLNISEMASFHKSSNNTSGTPSWEEDEFKNLSVHIFKFSSTYLEQPKLFYSILLTTLQKIEKQMETPTFFLSKLLKVFVRYFNETSQAILDIVKVDSRDASGESALDALKYEVTRTLDGSKGNKRVKLGKQIDILVDNVRIFACFIADLTIYFYNLDQLAFECQTATQDWVTIIDNPFLSRDVIANYYIDWLFDKQRSEKLLDIIRYESRDPNDVLSTNIANLSKQGEVYFCSCVSWKGLNSRFCT